MKFNRTLTLLSIFTLAAGLWFFEKPKTQNVVAQTAAPKLNLSSPLPANLFIELAKAVNPAIVNISTTQLARPSRRGRGQAPGRDPFFDLFEQFMGPQSRQRRPAQSLGTGFIIREDGLIVTNNHVIQGADVIKVQLDEKGAEIYEAKVIGGDQRSDIALIKIEAKKKLPVAVLGSSKDLKVGEWVAAFGNPYGHGHSVTKGIVSAIGREIDGLNILPFIQTDASINPGNSGGPLVDSRGLVIGVNTAIDARAQGIGFAIPIDSVKEIIPQLEKTGQVQRGFLGIYMTDLNPVSASSLGLSQSDGALVTKVMPKSPAAKAGLRPYDLIVKFGGKNVTDSAELGKFVARTQIGKKSKIEVLRDGKNKTLNLTVGTQPDQNRSARHSNVKTYKGQKAPYDYGFRVTDYSPAMAKRMGLDPLPEPRPIVIDVKPKSPAARAGLMVGDIILDLNKSPVRSSKALISKMKRKSNVLLILRGNKELLVHLRNR